jgi:SAM-dependent methyltransferase
MTDTNTKIREHYGAAGLTARIQSALAAVAPGEQPLTVDELAPLDQFHVRGMMATAELAQAAAIDSTTRVLDVGCGIGGPARSLAAMFSSRVTGVDLSAAFIEAATYLTARAGLADRVTFQVADALHLPFPDAAFDAVFLQHVAMNIEDRAALYAEVRRLLAPGGRFATYDLVLREGEVLYPVPWARDASTSFLLSEGDTRTRLEQAGFQPLLWRDDTEAALDWFQKIMAAAPAAAASATPNSGAPGSASLTLGLVMGPESRAMLANLARNLREHRLGLLSAVLTRG